MKLLYLGDSPGVTTGFGVVARYLCMGFQKAGMDVAALGTLQRKKHLASQSWPFRIIPTSRRDSYGTEILGEIIRSEKPDAVLLCNELLVTNTWTILLRKAGYKGPVVQYRGIPGEPIPTAWVEILKSADRLVVYTQYAKDLAKKYLDREVEYLYHGVDPDHFHPVTAERRSDLRKTAGWDDRFVVVYVARNRPNKNQPVLIQAISELRRRGIEGVLLYLHCMPVEEEAYRAGEILIKMGWDLPKLAEEAGVGDLVIYPPNFDDDTRGLDHVSSSPRPEELDGPSGLETLSLCERYACSDLYVTTSTSETFGMPLAEAMACGVPVAHRDDGGVMNEICSDAGYRIQSTIEVEGVFGEKGMVGLHPSKVADAIEHFYRRRHDEAFRTETKARAVEQSRKFRWEPTVKRMTEILEEAARQGATTWRFG